MRTAHTSRCWRFVLTCACLGVLLTGSTVQSVAVEHELPEIAVLAAGHQWQAAAQQIATYRARHPDSVDAAILQVEILIHMGLLSDANDVLQRVLAIHPRSIEALTAYANLSVDLHESATAEQLLLRCTRYCPHNPLTWQRLADFYLTNGRRETLVAFRRVLQLAPHNAGALAGIAVFHHQQAEDVVALRDFKQADAWNRSARVPDTMVDLRFGNFLFDKGEYGESLRHYQRAVRLNPSLVEARLGRAKDNVHLRQWQAAEKDLKITAATDPSRIESLNLLIKVYEAEGQAQEAINAATEAQTVSEQLNDEKAKRNRIATALQNARALQAQKHFDLAAKAYADLLQAQPDAQAAWMNLGECYAALKRVKDAETAFRRAIQVEPESPQTRVQLGKVLLQEQETKAARDEFSQALAIDPLFIDAQLGVGASFMFEHDYRNAIDALQKAKSIPGAGIEPRLMLTEAFLANRQWDLAMQELKDALHRYPENQQALAMRQKLRNAYPDRSTP